MNELVADYPDQEIHVILDNLNTHKPKIDRWLPKHLNVHFYLTRLPTRSPTWPHRRVCPPMGLRTRA